MNLQLISNDMQYERAQLIEPSASGFIHLAAEVQPSPIPLLPSSVGRSKLAGKLKKLIGSLKEHTRVKQAHVFTAEAIPPFDRFPNIRGRLEQFQIPRFDVAVLVETAAAADTEEVRNTEEFQTLETELREQAKCLHMMAAQNVKRVKDVDYTKRGTYLFNHFIADNQETLVELWEYLAGWYGKEMGVDNSLLLVPESGGASAYTAINHARLKSAAPAFAAKQMAKRSFREYVQANLNANGVIAMPVFYKLLI